MGDQCLHQLTDPVDHCHIFRHHPFAVTFAFSSPVSALFIPRILHHTHKYNLVSCMFIKPNAERKKCPHNTFESEDFPQHCMERTFLASCEGLLFSIHSFGEAKE